MRKLVLLLIGVVSFSACLDLDTENTSPNFALELLPIDKFDVPESFTPNKIDTITIQYTLPNGCYSFNELFYQSRDSIRDIAVTAFVKQDEPCTQALIKEDFQFALRIAENDKDYVLRFFKGKDNNGENIFEEVIVPVN